MSLNIEKKFGEFCETDMIEFLNYSECMSLFSAIGEAQGFTVKPTSSKKSEILLLLDGGKKIKLSPLNSDWSDNHACEKFILTALIGKNENISLEQLNQLNCDNPDVKFSIKTLLNTPDKYLVLTDYINLSGGVTIMNLIYRLQSMILNQNVFTEALCSSSHQVQPIIAQKVLSKISTH